MTRPEDLITKGQNIMAVQAITTRVQITITTITEGIQSMILKDEITTKIVILTRSIEIKTHIQEIEVESDEIRIVVDQEVEVEKRISIPGEGEAEKGIMTKRDIILEKVVLGLLVLALGRAL